MAEAGMHAARPASERKVATFCFVSSTMLMVPEA